MNRPRLFLLSVSVASALLMAPVFGAIVFAPANPANGGLGASTLAKPTPPVDHNHALDNRAPLFAHAADGADSNETSGDDGTGDSNDTSGHTGAGGDDTSGDTGADENDSSDDNGTGDSNDTAGETGGDDNETAGDN